MFVQHFLKYERNCIWVLLGPSEFLFQLTTARLVSFSVPNTRFDTITKMYGGKVISLVKFFLIQYSRYNKFVIFWLASEGKARKKEHLTIGIQVAPFFN